MMLILRLEEKEIKVSNPDKPLWPESGIKKIDYLYHLMDMAPFILKHTKDHPLTVIRYPHGIHGDSFFQKHLPSYTPAWVDYITIKEKKYINLNSMPTLLWLGNQAALEYHITFNTYQKPDYPSSIVFDLDPAQGQNFKDVVTAALLIKDTLDTLGIKSFPKTSGASGIQIYIPTCEQYTYEEARHINHFFGAYFSQKYPNHFTIERSVANRGQKIYFDYLQMWRGKTIISAYSPRAVPSAAVSTPITWKELEAGCHPNDFTLLNIKNRLNRLGDIFDFSGVDMYQNLSLILENLSN